MISDIIVDLNRFSGIVYYKQMKRRSRSEPNFFQSDFRIYFVSGLEKPQGFPMSAVLSFFMEMNKFVFASFKAIYKKSEQHRGQLCPPGLRGAVQCAGHCAECAAVRREVRRGRALRLYRRNGGRFQ